MKNIAEENFSDYGLPDFIITETHDRNRSYPADLAR